MIANIALLLVYFIIWLFGLLWVASLFEGALQSSKHLSRVVFAGIFSLALFAAYSMTYYPASQDQTCMDRQGAYACDE